MPCKAWAADAITQEVIDIAAVLNALRVGMSHAEMTDYLEWGEKGGGSRSLGPPFGLLAIRRHHPIELGPDNPYIVARRVDIAGIALGGE